MTECSGECAGAPGVWAKMWLMITQDGMQKLGGGVGTQVTAVVLNGLALVTIWEGSVLLFYGDRI